MFSIHELDSRRKIILVLSLVNLVIATYLTINVSGNCSLAFGVCETVHNSPYGNLFGIPLSVFGIVYALICIITIFKYSEQLGFVLSVGVGVEILLYSIQVFVLEHVCYICMLYGFIVSVSWFIQILNHNNVRIIPIAAVVVWLFFFTFLVSIYAGSVMGNSVANVVVASDNSSGDVANNTGGDIGKTISITTNKNSNEKYYVKFNKKINGNIENSSVNNELSIKENSDDSIAKDEAMLRKKIIYAFDNTLDLEIDLKNGSVVNSVNDGGWKYYFSDWCKYCDIDKLAKYKDKVRFYLYIITLDSALEEVNKCQEKLNKYGINELYVHVDGNTKSGINVLPALKVGNTIYYGYDIDKYLESLH